MTTRLGLDHQMEDLVNTDEIISDADVMPATPVSSTPGGAIAPELLSNMSGDVS